MKDFFDILKHTRKILSDDGILILRILVFPSYAWNIYRRDWVQIDAPRNINIFSIQAIADICAQCGFIIKYTYNDSNYF